MRRYALRHGHPAPDAPRRGLLARIGPGLITGASDDDPSGIATYSQVGSQFGLNMLWTMVLSYPLMSGIQEISARVGLVTGHGLAASLRKHFPRWVLYAAIGMLFVANTINIGADIGAMGAALHLLIGGPHILYVLGFGLLCLGLQVFVPYRRYVPYLKWLCLGLFAYVGNPLRREDPLAERPPLHLSPARSVHQGSAHGHRGHLRDHDQPLPLLLAGIRGGGGSGDWPRRRRPYSRLPARRRSSSGRCRRTPGWAWRSPTSWPSSSSSRPP